MEHHPGEEVGRELLCDMTPRAEAQHEGDDSVDGDTDPQLRIAGLPPISRRHAAIAFSKMKSVIKDDIKHRKGKFCLVPSSTAVTEGAGKSIAGSSVWGSFSRILDVEMNILVEFASCNKCAEVYSCNSRHGTTTLSKHSAKCGKVGLSNLTGQALMSEFIMKITKPTTKEREKVTNACVKMCAQDFRPFNTVGCEGFVNLVQQCMDIASKSHGRMLARDLLPSPSTVSRNVQAVKDLVVHSLSETLYQHSNTDGIGLAFTTDMYTENFTKVSYSALTCHFLDDDFKLRYATLGCKEFPEDTAHTAENIKNETLSILSDYGLDHNNLAMDGNCFTTDDGSGNTGQLGIINCFSRVTCSDHKISTVIGTVLNKTTTMSDGRRSKPFYRYMSDLPTTLTLIDDCKSLVQYFNQANLQKLLTKTLKSENDTRWSSLFDMLLSVNEAFDQVKAVLRVKRKDDKVDRISRSLLSQLLSFLQEFKIATKRLEGVKMPTIHLVVLSLAQMTRNCETPTGGDTVCLHPEIIKLSGIVKTVLIAKFKLHKIHIAAAFLDPRQTSRLLNNHRIDHSLLTEGLELVELLFDRHYARSEQANTTSTEQAMHDDGLYRPRKKSKSLFAMDDEEHAYANTGRPLQTEVDQFKLVRLRPDDVEDENFDLLLWWCANRQQYPILAKVARYILAIPASSAESERVFSASSNTITQKRTQLLPSNLNGLLIIKSNIALV